MWKILRRLEASSLPATYDLDFLQSDKQFFYVEWNDTGQWKPISEGLSYQLKAEGFAVYLYCDYQSSLITIVSQ